VEAGLVKTGPYTVADAVRHYLEDIRAEKKAESVRSAEYTFNAFVLPELGTTELDKLTPDRRQLGRRYYFDALGNCTYRMGGSS
jgi:hypothetical protein